MFLTQVFQFDVISIVLVVLFFAFIIVGAVKGFFKMLIELAGSALSAIVSIFLARPVGMFIYDLGTFNGLITKSINFLNGKSVIFLEQITDTNKEELINKCLEEFNIPGILSSIITSIGTKIIPTTNGMVISEYLSKALYVAISVVIAGILLFIIINIIIFILKLFLNKLDEIKPIKKLNHFLGAIIGVVNGLVVVLVIFIAISLLLMVPSLNEPIGSLMGLHNDKVWTFSKWLYELDILGIILKLIGF